jgi:hypothetical protein
MKTTMENFGNDAGKVWIVLNKSGPLNTTTLQKKSRLSEHNFYAAVGWLARENKIFKNGSKYELRETNLTNKIGEDAGKIWNVLSNQGYCDISSIAKITQITVRDAYSALGWLAREDKISLTKEKNYQQFKIRLK